MGLIPLEVIDEIQRRADIADLIGRYLPLKRAGRHYKAHCPFHKEKTPSFMVNTDKQIFHCFGCGVGGNIFSFLMQHDRLTFPEAVRQLADQFGLEIPDSTVPGIGEPNHSQFLALLEKVCQYFERTLAHPQQGKAARAYLAQRGVSEQARMRFRLGLAPDGWDHLLTAAKSSGVSPDALEQAGLLVRREKNLYDRFRQRLIFPILDIRGRVVGFGGRSLDGKQPKYLNSPETSLYSKGRILFGLTQAKEAITDRRTAIIVEGYFDCVVLSDAGIPQVVSPLGTALTREQIQLLKRYAERVILAFDADTAGEAATMRGLDLLVEAGLQVQVAQLPVGVDPDEHLHRLGKEEFERWLNQSLPLVDALIAGALRRYPHPKVEETVKAAESMLPTIAKVPNAILRNRYVHLIADRLRLDEAAMLEEMTKYQNRSNRLRDEGKSDVKTFLRQSVASGPERLFTALVLDDATRWNRVEGQLMLEDVTDSALRRILEVVIDLSEQETSVSPAQVVSRLSGAPEGVLVTELVAFAQDQPTSDLVFEDCVRRLVEQARTRRLDGLRSQIQSAQESGREEAVRELLVEFQRQVKTPERSGALNLS